MRAGARAGATRDATAAARPRATRGARAGSGLVLLVILAACGEPRVSAETSGGSTAPIGVASRASSEPFPERFGVGRPATEAEIAALDIDVMPDGAGLPRGSGTVSDGGRIYAARCGACHGADLQGTPLGDRLASHPDYTMFPDGEVPPAARSIGNYWPYATTLFDYTRRAMPFDRPGSLTYDEVYAVTAWLLWKNGVIGEGEVMDATTLPAVVMPARDRFVPDDRLEHDRVR